MYALKCYCCGEVDIECYNKAENVARAFIEGTSADYDDDRAYDTAEDVYKDLMNGLHVEDEDYVIEKIITMD